MLTKEQSEALAKRRAAYLAADTVLPGGEVVTGLQATIKKVAENNPELYKLSLEDRAVEKLFMEIVVASSIGHNRASVDEEWATLREKYPRLVFVSTNDPNLSALEDTLLGEGTLSVVDKVSVRRAVVRQMDEENR